MNQAERTALTALPISLLTALGLAWVGSQGSALAFGVPIFALCILVAFVIQWIAFIPAYLQKTETFFDLVGSITFLSVVFMALYLSEVIDARKVLLAIIISIWAIRLGAFLFGRIHATGIDSRFDEIKVSFLRFLLAWSLQGMWVAFSLAAAVAAMSSRIHIALDLYAWVGLFLWIAGFGIEVMADYQKQQFRKQIENKGKFIHTGLWFWSRHPNYFGEILLWIGVAVIAFPVLSGWQYITLISPVFVTFLLTRVSGIPMLEAKADEKWGGQADYEAYKARTSVLIPIPPR